MNAVAASSFINGPRARKLLRLYLAWPHRFEADPEEEARLFYLWLKENYSDFSMISALRSETEIAEFLNHSPEIIEAAKYLKPREGNAEALRREKRISTNTHVLIGVYECSSDTSWIGHTVRGSVMDVTPNGIGIELPEPLPGDAILTMTVASAGHPIVLYRVTGEVRWVSGVNDRYLVGVRLFDVDDAMRWRSDFDKRFRSSDVG